MIRILHLGSFIGNIGDNASHIGLQTLLKNYFRCDVTKIEIRKFYKSYNFDDKKYFDPSFIDYLNTFDLVIIGGGGFLDFWVENSATGTTLDIDPTLVKRIAVPTLITSVGCIPHKTVPPGNIEKFRSFLDALIENRKVRIALRNDGSSDIIKNTVGAHYLSNLHEILDHGFFYDATEKADLPLQNYVAINITSDQLLMQNNHGIIDVALYYREMVNVVEHLVEYFNFNILFLPHIHQDLQAINTLVSNLPSFMARSHVFVAPCIQGDSGCHYLFSLYKQSQLVIGSRFHANVCSVAMGKKVVGLSILDRVKYLFDSIGLSENCINVEKHFAEQLLVKIENNEMGVNNKILEEKKKLTLDFYRKTFDHFGLQEYEK